VCVCVYLLGASLAWGQVQGKEGDVLD